MGAVGLEILLLVAAAMVQRCGDGQWFDDLLCVVCGGANSSFANVLSVEFLIQNRSMWDVTAGVCGTWKILNRGECTEGNPWEIFHLDGIQNIFIRIC